MELLADYYIFLDNSDVSVFACDLTNCGCSVMKLHPSLFLDRQQEKMEYSKTHCEDVNFTLRASLSLL